MEQEFVPNENRELSGIMRIKRNIFWSRRFIVIKSGILYYYKSATTPVPRGIYHLSGCKILKETKDCIIDIVKENSKTLKIQFQSANELNLWYQTLMLSTQVQEKPQIHGLCTHQELEKSIEKENQTLINQIPKVSMPNVWKNKIDEIKNRAYKLVGTKGYAVFATTHSIASEAPRLPKDNTLWIAMIFATWEVVRMIFGDEIAMATSILAVGYFYSLQRVPKDKPIVDTKCHFKCSLLIKSGAGEILTALHDTLYRTAWEPYLIDSSESNLIKLTYQFNSSMLFQEFSRTLTKDSETFILIESIQNDIKNLFVLESKNKKGELLTLVTHYGTLNSSGNPLVGNADLLSCLKHFVESNTVYVSNIEVPLVDKSSDDEDLQTSQSILEDTNSSYLHEAQRVLKEAEALLQETEGWEELRISSKVVRGSKKKVAAGLFVVKGEGIINRSPAEIIEVLKDTNGKGAYDTSFESGYIVETLDPSSEIVYQKYKGKLGVSARDFCILQKRFDFPDGRVIAVATSVTHPQCPETKFVRGHLFIGCHILTPVGPNTTNDIYMIYVDIKGSVPKFLANTVQSEQAMLVDNLRNLLSS